MYITNKKVYKIPGFWLPTDIPKSLKNCKSKYFFNEKQILECADHQII